MDRAIRVYLSYELVDTAKIAIIFEIARKNAECFITYILFISDMLRNENISLYLQQKT